MKNIFLAVAIVLSINTIAQTNQNSIQLMPAFQSQDNELADYFKTSLLNQVNQEIARTGSVAVDVSRFIVLVHPDIIDKNNNGQLLLLRFNVQFSIIDQLTKKSYNNFSVDISGVGHSQRQAVMDAVRRFDIKKSRLSENIKEANNQIVQYYKANCSDIISNCKSLAKTKQYDEAIAALYFIPEISGLPCAGEINSTIESIYQQSAADKCSKAVRQAQTQWSLQPNAEGAASVSSILSNVDVTNDCMPAYNKLISEIKQKIIKDQFDDLNFKQKVYTNNIDLEKQRIAATRDIAVEYFKNSMPVNYNYSNYNNAQVLPATGKRGN